MHSILSNTINVEIFIVVDVDVDEEMFYCYDSFEITWRSVRPDASTYTEHTIPFLAIVYLLTWTDE